MNKRTTKLVREGSYAVEVAVDLIEDETGWSPYLSRDDALKLDGRDWLCAPVIWRRRLNTATFSN